MNACTPPSALLVGSCWNRTTSLCADPALEKFVSRCFIESRFLLVKEDGSSRRTVRWLSNADVDGTKGKRRSAVSSCASTNLLSVVLSVCRVTTRSRLGKQNAGTAVPWKAHLDELGEEVKTGPSSDHMGLLRRLEENILIREVRSTSIVVGYL